ncbi:MAG: PrsW family intramembrane metalloprotease [Burkholderiales bacterium]|nr:PrsW family intramembrane metalloprotease [Burkholderiales bacterium]
MSGTLLSHALVGLLPVVLFLLVLLWLDSYKLVSMRLVLAVTLCGVAAAVACYFVNGWLVGVLALDVATYARTLGPAVEEAAKGLVVVALIRANRVGFLVDAAICGFAVGAGFAMVENLQYQRLLPDAGLATWIVRGFGTAIMHGGVTAIFAMMGLTLLEKAERAGIAAFVPGYALAVALHAAFNLLGGSPRAATLAVLLVLPPLMFVVFQRSERAVGAWLGRGFDADAAMLASINSGRFADSPAGRYLESLRRRFRGPVVADLLCYLRLHTELALRAKGVLMMRENGFDAPVDEATRDKFAEMDYLESSIGRTGLLALKPMLHMSHRDLWQLHMLGK